MKSGVEYQCSAGETADLIALLIYGNERYAADILNENPEYCTTCVFQGGERLQMPVIEMPESESGMTAERTAPWRRGG